jgi:hypothetical protein
MQWHTLSTPQKMALRGKMTPLLSSVKKAKCHLQSPQDATIMSGAAYAAATQQHPLSVDVALIISASSW